MQSDSSTQPAGAEAGIVASSPACGIAQPRGHETRLGIRQI